MSSAAEARQPFKRSITNEKKNLRSQALICAINRLLEYQETALLLPGCVATKKLTKKKKKKKTRN